MEQDVSCFPSDALTVPQTSLQPGLNRLYEPQFTITQGRNRRSQRNTSGVSLLCFLFIIWPSLFAVLLSDKLNKTHSGNSKKCSFGDLRGVRRPPAGGVCGGGGLCLPFCRYRALERKTFADVILFASDLPGEVKGGAGGVVLRDRLLRITDRGTVTERGPSMGGMGNFTH